MTVSKLILGASLLFGGVVSFTQTAYSAEKTCTGTDTSGLSAGDYCYVQPTYYGITVYEMGLCIGAPTAPTTTSAMDVSNCSIAFSNPAGSLVSVENGATSTPSGTFSRPADGAYTHAYMRLNNTFLIKASVNFGAGHASGIAQFCTSNTGTGDNENGGVAATCAGAAGTPGLTTTELTDFSGSSSSGTNTTTVGNLTVYLLDSIQNMTAVATEMDQAGAAGIFGVQAFTTPVVVTDATTALDAAITVSQGSTISLNAGPAVTVDSGPFSLTLSVN